jgi:hypothetical protein
VQELPRVFWLGLVISPPKHFGHCSETTAFDNCWPCNPSSSAIVGQNDGPNC